MPTGQETIHHFLGQLRPARTSRVSSNRGGLVDSNDGRTLLMRTIIAVWHSIKADKTWERKVPTCWKVLGKKSPFGGNGEEMD